MNDPAAVLVMYHRYGCHLCDDMLGRLRELQTGQGFRLEMIDVDTDPLLATRYGERLPVLEGGGEEICHHFLDEPALERFLTGFRSIPG